MKLKNLITIVGVLVVASIVSRLATSYLIKEVDKGKCPDCSGTLNCSDYCPRCDKYHIQN